MLQRELTKKQMTQKKWQRLQLNLTKDSIGNKEVGLETFLNQLAQRAGSIKITSVMKSSPAIKNECTLQWEGDQQSSFLFLELLEKSGVSSVWLQVQMHGQGHKSREISGTLRFIPGFHKHTDESSLSMVQVRQQKPKHLFASVVSPQVNKPIKIDLQTRARSAESQRLEEEKLKNENKIWIEKKQFIEANLILTGIVNNGQYSLALINRKDGPNRTGMFKVGDSIQEARVSFIDESAGMVQLDLAGREIISLRLNSNQIQGSY
jgi:hypothetical protein